MTTKVDCQPNYNDMKRKSDDNSNVFVTPKKLAVFDEMPVPVTVAVQEPTKCADKRKFEQLDEREGRIVEEREELFCRTRKRNKSDNTILSTRISSFTKKNRVEVADAPKVSVPLYHTWKMPSADVKAALAEEADSAFNSFNFWREALPPVEEDCGANNYGDFSWWRVTPPEVLDLDVISEDSE